MIKLVYFINPTGQMVKYTNDNYLLSDIRLIMIIILSSH